MIHPVSLLLVGILATMVPGTGLTAEEFTLHINDPSGLQEPWPLIAGLPFPEGALHDVSKIRLMRDGTEVPAQIDTAATWKDGSIRWAMAGFTADPHGDYQVEFGEDVSRSEFTAPLSIQEDESGRILVDTGAAVYEFHPHKLLPNAAHMGETPILEGSGDGAYLVDNHGRLTRVASEAAEIETKILVDGPGRAVLMREGWYVTEEGERLARAKAWFYFAAGTPYLRVTHSLIFTEDTNELWVRDYGLEFRTPGTPHEAAFPLAATEKPPEELLSLRPVEVESVFKTPLNGGETFMLQDVYPHYLEEEALAVVGHSKAAGNGESAFPTTSRTFWVDEWLAAAPAVGDWADAKWEEFSMTVVLPWLAQRFPKEIAFGPEGARVAFWSGRSGRELDFRAPTLVNEYWQTWAEEAGRPRGPEHAAAVAREPSNAQGAARTHDVWLLPHQGEKHEDSILKRAAAASRTPLVLADPAWMCATEAIGWPMHPLDVEEFPEEEAVLAEFWERLMQEHYEGWRQNGFIAWGANPLLRSPRARHFRVATGADYALRRHIWGLLLRGGDRSFYDYGMRFNRFAGDWRIAHWTVGDKFKGGFVRSEFWRDKYRPFFWGEFSYLAGGGTGSTILNWLMEYYLTGDEYVHDLTRMIGDAFLDRWDDDEDGTNHRGAQGTLGALTPLYAREWDETFGRIARQCVDIIVDPETSSGLSDNPRYAPHGVYYKTGRKLLALYDYYHATGDETARQAFLTGIEDLYRFHHTFDRTDLPGGRGAFGGQSYFTFLFSIAYQWTGRKDYLAAVNRLIEDHRDGPPEDLGLHMYIISQMNPFMGVPTALQVLSRVEEPIAAFPVLETDEPKSLTFEKEAGTPVEIKIYIRTTEEMSKGTAPEVTVRLEDSPDSAPAGVRMHLEQMFESHARARWDPRRWYLQVNLPAELPAGRYAIDIGHAGTITVLASDADPIVFDE